MEVAATSRQARKSEVLKAAGVARVLLDAEVHTVWPDGPDHVLDLVGARTIPDSLRLVRPGGTVCVSGSLSGWALTDFEPIAMIPSGTRLTAFHSDTMRGRADVLQRVVDTVEAGLVKPIVDSAFALDDIAAAHHHMETDQAAGKVVMLP
ncbi:hypothetical protein Acy02nite_57580 [Actinoplanes cyaneus]|uniref:Uncharacterized protein n=1 Tax=Actinoplanes cyaneus TaxID=52696 RepID=A0A919IP33_9ACTN|nr:zinc-binding dehydrogenase [Actinoplanes cyaneus]MCW2139833.1 Zinc-binding dehydrogenase [Actinoplanes cyaneus]GID67877.1 hypothetical protein Acy02nite_57580 [Actinoplanes cyaneus]